MNRAEFMRQLTILLSDVPPAEREEAIQYYNDYFDDAGAENEAGVIASLGTPKELARAIKAGLNDGGNVGEFTESGFQGYGETHKNEVMKTDEYGGASGDGYTQQGDNPYGSVEGAQSGYGQNSYGQGTYGQNSYEQNAYGQNAYGQGTYGQGAYGQNVSGQSTCGQTSQGSGVQKKPMSGGMIALIVIALILSSPLWIGILGTLFGCAVGLLAALLGVFLAFLIVGVVLAVVGIALFVAGIAAIFSAPLGGLCMMGGGMICFAIGLVFIWLMVIVVATAIPGLIRGIVNLCNRLFHRGGARA